MSKFDIKEEHLFIITRLNQCLSDLINEYEFDYCYSLQVDQHNLMVKDDVEAPVGSRCSEDQ